MDALLSSLNADTSTEGAQIQALDGDVDSQNREAAPGPAVPQAKEGPPLILPHARAQEMADLALMGAAIWPTSMQ